MLVLFSYEHGANGTENTVLWYYGDDGIMDGIGSVQDGAFLKLKKLPDGNGLKVLDVDGKRYLEVEYHQNLETGKAFSKRPLLVSLEDFEAHGFNAGDENDISRDLLATHAFSGGSTKGTRIHPEYCLKGMPCFDKLPSGTNIKITNARTVLTNGENGLELASYVKVKNKDVPGSRDLWIDHEETTFDPNPTPSSDDPEGCDCQHDENDELKETSNQALDRIDYGLMKFIGDCYNKPVGGKLPNEIGGDFYIDQVVPDIQKKMAAQGVTDKKEIAKLIQVDLLARTIYSEMASCNKYSKAYLDAVGKVIMNRADYINDKLKAGGTSYNDYNKRIDKTDNRNIKAANEFLAFGNRRKIRPHAGVLGEIALRNYAFSIYNPKDPAGKNAFCPKKPSPGKKALGPATRAFKSAVAVAREMVFSPNAFKKRTANVKELFYTSNITFEDKDYVESPARSVGGTAMNKKSCIRLWASQRIRKREGNKWGTLDEFLWEMQDVVAEHQAGPQDCRPRSSGLFI